MARIILDGFKNLEEALAFAEWFGYNGVEVVTPGYYFTAEADDHVMVENFDTVEISIVTNSAQESESDTDYGGVYVDVEQSKFFS